MKPSTIEIVNKTLKKRRANETIFRSFGLVSILLGILSLVFLLTRELLLQFVDEPI